MGDGTATERDRAREPGAVGRPWWRDWTALGLLFLLLASLAVQVTWAREELTPGRFFDERHALRNVRALVLDGRLRPPNALYPSLSYLPYAPVLAAAETLHGWTGLDALDVFDDARRRRVSETGYLLARLVSVIVGALCLVLTYRLGRRTISPQAGLLAAALLSVTWGFLLVSIKVKPDVLVMLLALVTFWWTLDALERPSARRFALAGVGVGLAAAAKYYGVTAAIPLVAAALVEGGRRAVTWGRLSLAGGASIATFFLLNPWPDLVLQNVALQRHEYARRGAEAGMSHWDMLVEAARWLSDDNHPVVFVFIVLGCAGLAARATVARGDRPGRRGAVTLAAMILGYFLFFASATTYFTFQNFVPINPFTSIAGAWAMVALSEAAVRRLPARARTGVRALVWVPVAAWVLSVHASRIYDVRMPTTTEVALRQLMRLDGQRARVVYQEPFGFAPALEGGGDGPATLPVDSALDTPPEVLRRADGVVFPAERLEGPDAASYRRFLEGWDGPVLAVEPTWFAARGPALVMALSEWRLLGEPFYGRLERREGSLRTLLPQPLQPGEAVSLAVLLHGRRRDIPTSLHLEPWGRVQVHSLPAAPRQSWVVTPKLPVRRRTGELRMDLPGEGAGPESVLVEAFRWQREPPHLRPRSRAVRPLRDLGDG